MLHADLIPNSELLSQTMRCSPETFGIPEGKINLPVCATVEGILRFISVEGSEKKYARILRRIARKYFHDKIFQKGIKIGAESDNLRTAFLENKLFRDDVIDFILRQRDKTNLDHRTNYKNPLFLQTLAFDELKNMSQDQVISVLSSNTNAQLSSSQFKSKSVAEVKKIRQIRTELASILDVEYDDQLLEHAEVFRDGTLYDIYYVITAVTVWEACRIVSMQDPFMAFVVDKENATQYSLREIQTVLKSCPSNHPNRGALIKLIEERRKK